MITWVLLFIACFSCIQAQCPAGYDCSGMCDALSAGNISNNASAVFPNMSAVILPCPLGFLCYENSLPIRCPRGYYCPNATSAVDCPSGSYCGKGSSTPRNCPPGAVCPKKAWKYVHVLAIFILLITHLVIYFLYKILNRSLIKGTNTEIELKELKQTEGHNVTLNFWFQELKVIIRTGNFITKLWGPKKTLLNGVSGRFECGRLAAIMGPSGAGKSTFVSVLLGKISKDEGTILINGNESTKVNTKKSIGYVPQEDIMLRQGVTVRDILMHSAVSRLPSTWTKEEIETKVTDTLRVLQLESVQNNFIGDEITRGLSGGERKRVNIGMELVANPVALVLDEPTSGLDTTSAHDIMNFLKQIAQDLNMTVIVVLHQPRHEIYELCDDLLLLGKGGHTAYIGSVAEVDSYFAKLGYPCPEHVNPADHFIDIVSGKIDSPLANNTPNLEYLIDSWKKNEGNFGVDKQKPSPVPQSATGPFYRQFFANCQRSFLQLFRDVSGRMVDNFLHLLAGAIIAIGFASEEMFVPPVPRHYLPLCPSSVAKEFCWYPEVISVNRLPSFATISVGLAASTIGVRTFFNESPVYWRETGSGMNTVAYFIAKNIVDIIPIFLYALTFTSAFVVVATPVGSFSNYLLMILLYEYCLYPVGYICTHLTDSNPSMLAVIVALLSGLGTQAIGVPFMWSRWASEGLINAELDYDGQPDEIKPMVEEYIISWDYKKGSFNECILALVLIGLGLRLLAYILMRITKRDKQT